MLTYNRTQASPWSRAILPALLQGTLPSVSPKGMAAHKTEVAAVNIKAAIKSLLSVLKGKVWYWMHIPQIIYFGNANPISSTKLSSKIHSDGSCSSTAANTQHCTTHISRQEQFHTWDQTHHSPISFRKDWGKCTNPTCACVISSWPTWLKLPA